MGHTNCASVGLGRCMAEGMCCRSDQRVTGPGRRAQQPLCKWPAEYDGILAPGSSSWARALAAAYLFGMRQWSEASDSRQKGMAPLESFQR